MNSPQTIRLLRPGAPATHVDGEDEICLSQHFTPLAAAIGNACRTRGPGGQGQLLLQQIAAVSEFLTATERLDRTWGGDRELPLADADTASNAALEALANIEAALPTYDLLCHQRDLHVVQIGLGLWMMRHGLPMTAAEVLVNALAHRANQAAPGTESAATYALMQRTLAHLEPTHGTDLERSNPERAWRVLNLNFAITAIRSGDPELMRFAFDALNHNLPDECAGFWRQAAEFASALPPDHQAEIASAAQRAASLNAPSS